MDAGKLEIISRKEAIAQGLKYYFTGKPCKYGHVEKRTTIRSDCVTCEKLRKVKYEKVHKEKIQQNKKLAYQKNKKEIDRRNMEWRKNNPKRAKEIATKWRNENLELARQRIKVWGENNPHKKQFYSSKRRATKLNATPEWLNAGHMAEIEGVYLYTKIFSQIGEKLHVDHIVPLQGENVCGLHVPWNLQAIPAFENLSKSNKLIEE